MPTTFQGSQANAPHSTALMDQQIAQPQQQQQQGYRSHNIIPSSASRSQPIQGRFSNPYVHLGTMPDPKSRNDQTPNQYHTSTHGNTIPSENSIYGITDPSYRKFDNPSFGQRSGPTADYPKDNPSAQSLSPYAQYSRTETFNQNRSCEASFPHQTHDGRSQSPSRSQLTSNIHCDATFKYYRVDQGTGQRTIVGSMTMTGLDGDTAQECETKLQHSLHGT
ncbi:uncharacterized protein IL334_001447 [Kwoniella shivajii]|uniref:Velvet domain-containing protein n=1 Tax=Kwoniella shivajii TaxID=564305 RepID=A0ABZ1CSA4_9TREE|nr:hypothetical protein IL334_001447 [Kwoniella shivajii]